MNSPGFRLYIDARMTSPYALSVFVALREKSLPFDLLRVDLDAGEHFLPGYRALSLTGRIPTLEHQGLALSESSAITEYLDEVFPTPAHAPLYPDDPAQRARARQVQAWLRSDLQALREERPTTVIFEKARRPALSVAGRAAADKLFQAAQALLGAQEDSLFGRWCIADTDLALMLNRLLAHGDEVPAPLAAYVRRQWSRSSVQAWVELKGAGR